MTGRFDLTRRLPDGYFADALHNDVLKGLTGRPKSLPPKWFYDARGSELFEEITQLPEYYPTRAEHEILRERCERSPRPPAPVRSSSWAPAPPARRGCCWTACCGTAPWSVRGARRQRRRAARGGRGSVPRLSGPAGDGLCHRSGDRPGDFPPKRAAPAWWPSSAGRSATSTATRGRPSMRRTAP